MEVVSQAPQPTIKCYHSIQNGAAVKDLYQEFSPASTYFSGKNLQSYNFENSIDNFGGSFSFSIKEDVPQKSFSDCFMDSVQPLDIIEISETGDGQTVDFIGVVTKISVGGIASNLTKTVTVSGKSIEWLFTFLTINTDIKACIFQNEGANNTFKTDLEKNDGKEGISIKDLVIASFKMFVEQTTKHKEISNFVIGDVIKKWYGNDYGDYVVASNEVFAYPISSNLFENGKINVIDYIKKLLPSPLYEIYGYIDGKKPKLGFRKAPYDIKEVKAKYKINPVQLTDFTLTRTCEEIYTAFMPYIEGSSMSPDFYMNVMKAGSIKETGYDYAFSNQEKVKLYGFQLLTCSFAGYNSDADNPSVDFQKLSVLGNNLKDWFGNLEDMLNGDFTVVNIPDDGYARIGEWLGFTDGQFYVHAATHTWNYGDNPMINYQVSRGGKYSNGSFIKLDRLSQAYREFE